jgi:hypothetical protein
VIDITKISPVLLENRGAFLTVHSAYKDEMKRLQMMQGELSSYASKILNRLQPKTGEPEPVADLIEAAREVLNNLDKCADNIIELVEQKKVLHPMAFPK